MVHSISLKHVFNLTKVTSYHHLILVTVCRHTGGACCAVKPPAPISFCVALIGPWGVSLSYYTVVPQKSSDFYHICSPDWHIPATVPWLLTLCERRHQGDVTKSRSHLLRSARVHKIEAVYVTDWQTSWATVVGLQLARALAMLLVDWQHQV